MTVTAFGRSLTFHGVLLAGKNPAGRKWRGPIRLRRSARSRLNRDAAIAAALHALADLRAYA